MINEQEFEVQNYKNLIKACEEGDIENVKKLLENFDKKRFHFLWTTIFYFKQKKIVI